MRCGTCIIPDNHRSDVFEPISIKSFIPPLLPPLVHASVHCSYTSRLLCVHGLFGRAKVKEIKATRRSLQAEIEQVLEGGLGASDAATRAREALGTGEARMEDKSDPSTRGEKLTMVAVGSTAQSQSTYSNGNGKYVGASSISAISGGNKTPDVDDRQTRRGGHGHSGGRKRYGIGTDEVLATEQSPPEEEDRVEHDAKMAELER